MVELSRRRRREGAWPRVQTWLDRVQAIGVVVALLWSGYLEVRFHATREELEHRGILLSNRTAELTNSLKEEELRQLLRDTVTVSAKLRVICQREQGVYFAEFSYQVLNTSKQDVPLSWEVIESHLGTMSPVAVPASGGRSMVLLNDPPVRSLKVSSRGAVEWQPYLSTAHVLESGGLEKVKAALASFHVEPGGAVKMLRPGGKSGSKLVIRVAGHPDQWVGVSLAFGIGRELRMDDSFRETSMARLRDCERDRAPSAKGVKPRSADEGVSTEEKS